MLDFIFIILPNLRIKTEYFQNLTSPNVLLQHSCLLGTAIEIQSLFMFSLLAEGALFWIFIGRPGGRHENIYLAKISNDIGERRKQLKWDNFEERHSARPLASDHLYLNSKVCYIYSVIITLYQEKDLVG